MASRRGPDNSVRVAVSGVLGAQPWANVFHCQLTTSSSISQADLDAWLTTFCNNYAGDFGPRQNSGVAYQLGKATLYTPGGGVLQSTHTMTGNGSSGGTGIANDATAKIVSWLSTVYWRGGKPRTYLAGVSNGEIASNIELNGTEVTALKTAGAAFRTHINAIVQGTITATSLGFVSFFSGNALRPVPLFYAITGATVHARLGTQRRRLGPWLN